jgi:methylisocitrate lyase
MRPTTRFRSLVTAPAICTMPGVIDPLSARIAAEAGFEAVTCGGFAATATLLGQPDTSQLGLTEMADHYARICDSIDLPVFGDMDTGFGNVTNVRRAVRAYERAGLAGFFIEDQVFPKRCGHMAGKAVVPVEDMLGKLKAALDARQDSDLVIMARTDALAVNGLDDAIERANLYRACGADMLFIEAPTTVEDMERICREVDGPCMANNVEGGLTPLLAVDELERIGYAAVAFPVGPLFAVAHTLRGLMADLRRTGTTAGWTDRMLGFDDFTALVGLPALRTREQAMMDAAAALTRKT